MKPETLTKDMTVKVPLPQLWEAFKDLHRLLPRLLPGYIESSRYIGSPVGGGVGSIRDCRFSSEVPGISWSKEKIEEIDDERHVFSYKVVEGEVLEKFSSYKVTWSLFDKAVGVTDVNWTAEFVPLHENKDGAEGKDGAIDGEPSGRRPDQDNLYRDSATLLVKQLERHLLVTGEYLQPSSMDLLRKDILN